MQSRPRGTGEREERLRRRPRLNYPRELPIAGKRPEIVRAIKGNRVVIISGETGCGKSTQIPKMCLEAGRGIDGLVGCTQPRRIAAITIAHRIAEELGEPIGRSVGYKIRFQDKTPRDAFIKIMTDGMLLAETQSDRLLRAYDTIIIDEAHERSLNIDFLMGITRTLLATRRDLKVIITSATLDTAKFSEAFGRAPVIHIGGRTYPVEVEYRPLETFPGEPGELDYIEMAVKAVDELKARRCFGDILVFMPTEQDILETCERMSGKRYSGVTILPMYARLPASEQGRVYSVKGPKIVVATNVAETSLTIPGIKYVVDTGLARISQYQPGSRINSLPISPISRASADQRKGRCGRVEPGHCIRLYAEDEYEARPEFTPPEILRSNLAEVILRMIHLNLGHPLDFPFVDKPQGKSVKDGFDTLIELGAISKKGQNYGLTELGVRMAPMPLDPRISRMLIEAEKEGCVREVAVIASVLSIRDPRERPPEKADLADAAQAAFRHPDSDFFTLLNIWKRFHGPQEGLNSRARQRRFCSEHFLSYPRMREWGFVHDQILSILHDRRIPLGAGEHRETSAELYAGIHRSVLSGFLSNIAVHKEKNFYTAAKGREVMIFPGSTLFQKSRPWVVAAEMVQTARLYARTAARIDPGWLEELGGDLCRYSYSEPYWNKDRGEVRAKERVTLYGLEIVSGRDVAFGRINPEEANKIFIARALVEGEVKSPPPFLRHNLGLARKMSDMEEKLRRRDILIPEVRIAELYAERLAGVYDLRGLEKRIRTAGGDDFLRMAEQDLVLLKPDEGELAGFPDELDFDGRRFKAVYRFAPGDEDDGATVRVPSPLLKSIPGEHLDWGVPGQFEARIAALIKGLPKAYRKILLPAAEKVDIIVREMKPKDPSLFKNLARFVKERFGVDIPEREWARVEVPKHLRLRVAVTDHEERTVAAGRDIEFLKKIASQESASVPEGSPAWENARQNWERSGITSWDFGSLPESVPLSMFITAYPALVHEEKGVGIRLFRNREEALAAHEKGLEALLRPRFEKDLEFVKRYLALPEEYQTSALYFGGRGAMAAMMADRLGREVFRRDLRSQEQFDSYAETVVRSLFDKGHALQQTVVGILGAYLKVRRALKVLEAAGKSRKSIAELAAQMAVDLERLVPKNFLEIYAVDRLLHFPRYLKAFEVRAERGKNDPEKDRKKAEQVAPFEDALRRIQNKSTGGISIEKKKALEDFRWIIEEFRVAQFAPELKTAFPVSAKRLAERLREIENLD